MKILFLIPLLLALTACASQSDLDAANRATADAQRQAAVASQQAWDANRRADAASLQAAAQSAVASVQGIANSSGVLIVALAMVVLGGMYLTFGFVASQTINANVHTEEMLRLQAQQTRDLIAALERRLDAPDPPPALPPARPSAQTYVNPDYRVYRKTDRGVEQLPPGR